MQRNVATLPDTIEELCLVRFGVLARRPGAWPYAWRLARAIDREATACENGRLHSESFRIAWNHFGILQYWRSFDDLERWSHRPPHSDWWRAAADRMRRRDDLALYHEAFAVPRRNVESIYLNCQNIGLSAFGLSNEASGPRTTARDRLDRRTLSNEQ